MEQSSDVREALLGFYEAFSSGDPEAFAGVIATGPGVSVIGTEPGQGAGDRETWLDTYATQIAPLGVEVRAGDPVGFEEGDVGFAMDTPTAFLPDRSYLPLRATGVFHLEGDAWKLIHLHFSVGVPDKDVLRPPD